MQRRAFLRGAGVAGGTAVAGAAAGPAVAQEEGNGDEGGDGEDEGGDGGGDGGDGGGGGMPDFGGWLEGVDGGYEDLRGQDEVTVEVGAEGNDGAYAFAPAGVWVDTGATVIWEWTGDGGAHNVNAQEGADFSSGDPVAEAGETFEHTFEEGGITTYQCDPHADLGMVGAVAVGDDVPTVSTGGGGEPGEVDPHEMGVPFLAHYVGIATLLMMIVSLVFSFFVLKYGESRHASSPNRR